MCVFICRRGEKNEQKQNKRLMSHVWSYVLVLYFLDGHLKQPVFTNEMLCILACFIELAESVKYCKDFLRVWLCVPAI